jgi:hypothetical protein
MTGSDYKSALCDVYQHDDSWVTALGNGMFTKAINILFRSEYTDSLVMYRAFRTDLLDTLGFNNDKKDALFDILLSIRCAKLKLEVSEIPSSEPIRIGPGGSRAFPRLADQLKGGAIMLYLILREFLLWNNISDVANRQTKKL